MASPSSLTATIYTKLRQLPGPTTLQSLSSRLFIILFVACSFILFLDSFASTPYHQIGHRYPHNLTSPHSLDIQTDSNPDAEEEEEGGKGEEKIDTTGFTPLPSLDPWFRPPDSDVDGDGKNWTAMPMGSILKTRKGVYTNESMSRIGKGRLGDVRQLLFVSSDSNNETTWGVTTLFIPHTNTTTPSTSPSTPSSPSPSTSAKADIKVVSYSIPYDTASSDAAPSYLLQYGDPYGEIGELLGRGWTVMVTDYEGPGAAYCDGVQAGRSTLDGVRAVVSYFSSLSSSTVPGLRRDMEGAGEEQGNMNRAGLRERKEVERVGEREEEEGEREIKVALWGYSGGALATQFAAELLPSYAPDLLPGGNGKENENGKIVAITQGGLVPDPRTALPTMNKSPTTGLLIAGLLGITSQHEAARSLLISALHPTGPYNITGFLNATRNSGVDTLKLYEGQDLWKYFIDGENGGRGVLEGGLMGELWRGVGIMGKHFSRAGNGEMEGVKVMIYQSTNDEMGKIGDVDALVGNMCKRDGGPGWGVVYVRDVDEGGHNDELWQGRGRALGFLEGVLNGGGDEWMGEGLVWPSEGCSGVNVSVSVNVTKVGNGDFVVEETRNEVLGSWTIP